MGATLANTGEMDEAVVEYQAYLRLAPASDPNYPRIKAFVDSYQKSQR